MTGNLSISDFLHTGAGKVVEELDMDVMSGSVVVKFHCRVFQSSKVV